MSPRKTTALLLIASLSLFAMPTTSVGAEAARIAVAVDTTKTGEPISPFIYGQFIEHLGRCIYGGIWAEMLEDRKFFHPVTGAYAPYTALKDSAYPAIGASPWEIVGPADGVSMVTEKELVYVGRHAPRLREGSAIRHNDLGVVERRQYTGSIIARPAGRGRATISVSLAWGEGPGARVTKEFILRPGAFAKESFKIEAGATTDKARLEIRAVSGDVVLGPPSIMPADNVGGMRADTLALLKQLNGTIYRWPGGNFVSGYEWREGIGERDRRPPRKNPAWLGIEHNDFGTDEFLAFCREIKTEPMIAVSTGFGDAWSAAQWVEYCNSPASTLAGGWRAKNASEKPYGVKYWCVGNEMFGPWQLGFMQVGHYVQKHNIVAEAMWDKDPTAVLVAVGDLDGMNTAHDPDQVRSGRKWSHTMLENCADHMSMLSEHFYRGRVPWTQEGRVDVLTHVGMLKDSIRHKAVGHRALQSGLPNLKGRFIPIAMDEWNFWHREYAYGDLGCVYELQDGLGVAAGLHEFYRQSDIVKMAHYAQTVNVIGAIKTTRTAAEMETTGLVLQMYRAHYGDIPLKLEPEPAPYDVAAALKNNGRVMTLGVVNPTNAPILLELVFPASDLHPAGEATRWHVAGSDPTLHNTPGKPRVVDIARTDGIDSSKALEVPALSCALFEIPLR